MKAMADYSAGLADENLGKARAILAVIDYGEALLEGRKDRSNAAFKQWVNDNKLDAGKPWDQFQERSCAMKIASLVIGSVPITAFDACPNTRPTHIMKWYRKMHAPTEPRERKPARERKPSKAAQLDKAFEAIKTMEALGIPITEDAVAARADVANGTANKAISLHRQKRETTAQAKAEAVIEVTEDQALAAAEARFSEKSKLTVADAIRIYKARINKVFEHTVNAEVRRRIDAADDHVRKALAAERQTNETLTKLLGKKGIFSKRQFNQMKMLCHPDNSASNETKAELLQLLLKSERQLVNPEKE